MTSRPGGPTFHYGRTEMDGIEPARRPFAAPRLYRVYVGATPLPNRGRGRPPGAPLGAYLGRVWQQQPYGWVAAARNPDPARPDTWRAETGRSVRYFRSRREASVWLWGQLLGGGVERRRAGVAAQPGTLPLWLRQLRAATTPPPGSARP